MRILEEARMIIENIKAHETLNNFLVDECCENDVGVTFHPDIANDSILLLK